MGGNPNCMFSGWLRDSQLRKYEMNLAYRIGEMSRFNGIVFSSGALSESEIRSPLDAGNFFIKISRVVA